MGGQPVPCFEVPARDRHPRGASGDRRVRARRSVRPRAGSDLRGPRRRAHRPRRARMGRCNRRRPRPVTADHSRHIPAARVRRVDAARTSRGKPPRSPRLDRFDTATPIVAGTAAAARAAVDIGGSRRSTSCSVALRWRTRCAGRRGTTPGATSSAATATSTTPRSWPRRCGHGGPSASPTCIDFHHGNGRSRILRERDDVLYVSLQRPPRGHLPVPLGLRRRARRRRRRGLHAEPALGARHRWRRVRGHPRRGLGLSTASTPMRRSS